MKIININFNLLFFLVMLKAVKSTIANLILIKKISLFLINLSLKFQNNSI